MKQQTQSQSVGWNWSATDGRYNFEDKYNSTLNKYTNACLLPILYSRYER